MARGRRLGLRGLLRPFGRLDSEQRLERWLDKTRRRYGVPDDLNDKEALDAVSEALLVVKWRVEQGQAPDHRTAYSALGSVPDEYRQSEERRWQARERAFLLERERALGNDEAERLTSSELKERSELRVRLRLREELLVLARGLGHGEPEMLDLVDLLALAKERDPNAAFEAIERAFSGEQMQTSDVVRAHRAEAKLRRLADAVSD